MAKQPRYFGHTDGRSWPKDMKIEPEIVRRILVDYTPIIYPGRQISPVDVNPVVIWSIVLIENFMDRVSKSNQAAVEFDKKLAGITCRKINQLGQELYQLLAYPRFTPPQSEPGEGFKLFDEVMQSLNVSQAVFSRNPMRVISPSGLLEGDFLNVIQTQLQKDTCSKRYKLAQEQRKREVQRIAYGQTNLVTRLQELYPNLFGMYVDLLYHPDRADEANLAESSRHLQQMIELLKDDPLLGKSVGHYWTKSYSTESGYRSRLCLLFDGLTVPINSVCHGRVLELWRESTNSAGDGCVFPNKIMRADSLFAEIYFSARKNRYLRLIPSSNHPHFGISDLPRRKGPKYGDQYLTGRFQ